MWGWIKSIFNADPLGTITNALSSFTFTDQSRAQASQLYLEALTKYQEATQPQNVARRFISVFITCLAGILFIGAAIVYPFDVNYANFLLQLLGKVTISLDVIIAFYFLKRAPFFSKENTDGQKI